jgi:hypothetical protein
MGGRFGRSRRELRRPSLRSAPTWESLCHLDQRAGEEAVNGERLRERRALGRLPRHGDAHGVRRADEGPEPARMLSSTITAVPRARHTSITLFTSIVTDPTPQMAVREATHEAIALAELVNARIL